MRKLENSKTHSGNKLLIPSFNLFRKTCLIALDLKTLIPPKQNSILIYLKKMENRLAFCLLEIRTRFRQQFLIGSTTKYFKRTIVFFVYL